MPFPELVLQDAPPKPPAPASRADVAVFAGLVARRPGIAVPDALRQTLTHEGWAGTGPFARPPGSVDALVDLPVPLESWDAFDALFAWDQRPVSSDGTDVMPCPLGLAVRGFFEAGGLKAYVVRVGDPRPLVTSAPSATEIAARRALMAWTTANAPSDAGQRVPLIPGFGSAGTPPSAQDPASWHGAALILGIDDAAMLALPDLPDLLAGPPPPLAVPAPPKVVGSTTFVTCTGGAANTAAAVRSGAAQFAAPRLDRAGYRIWGQCMRTLLDLLSASGGSAHRRDVMLCASMPLPSRDASTVPADAEAWPLAILDEAGLPATNQRLTDEAIIGSAGLQLAWPWLLTAAAADAPEGLEAPEGRLMGMIARSAVERGAFRSAAGRLVPGVTGIVPMTTEAAMRRGLPNGRADWIGDRLCLVGQKTDQFMLLSDATMAASRSWRAGGVSRLMGLILRAARVMGQDRVFEPSGPALWNSVRQDLEGLMERLRTAGALAGDTPADAYTVLCDASTMTQSDIDLGRVIATVAFTAAQPIERIIVTLAMGTADAQTLQGAA
jgi:hypothetical protein